MSRAYLPIEDYGLIGNLNTTALVSKTDASVDFLCFPYCDSPTIFGRLLDSRSGGFFSICPIDENYRSKQLYLPSSNILQTRFNLPDGIAQITDLLPVYREENRESSDLIIKPWLMRKIDVVRGYMKFRIICCPSFDYGRIATDSVVNRNNVLTFESQHINIDLESVYSYKGSQCCSNVDWKIARSADKKILKALAEITLCEKESLILVLRQSPNQIQEAYEKLSFDKLCQIITNSRKYWIDWIAKSTYKGRWREAVHRSALVLKLLTFYNTGSMIAAPTFSLPEEIGGSLNWDYRFTWIRDAAFTVYAFMRIGLVEEAESFMNWIEKRCENLNQNHNKPLRILYDIHGRHPSFDSDEFLEETHSESSKSSSGGVQYDEIILDKWEGYEGSGPVRIGNAATTQDQVDIYGELMDAVYLCDKYCKPISFSMWKYVKEHVIEFVAKHWSEPDHGIWEIRGDKKQYVYSKVMCWVCLDRGIRLAIKHSLPCSLNEWRQTRDEIYEDVMVNGWNPELNSFVQYYDSATLDASNMIMPLVFFISPADERFLGTLERTLRPPSEGGLTVNNLVFRYDPSREVGRNEGTFNLCTFWLAEALALAGQYDRKYLERAVSLFENMIGYANHLGLFSEEIALSGRATGNFPQALTHLSLISAAVKIDRVMK